MVFTKQGITGNQKIDGLITIGLVWLYVFLLVNFDPALAIVLIALSFADATMREFLKGATKVITFNIADDKNHFIDFVWGVGLTAFFLFLSTIVTNIFVGTNIGGTSTQTVVKTLAATTPALEGSITITWIAFVIAFPIAESIGLVRAFEVIARQLKIKLQSITISGITLAAMISVGFMLLHLTARSIAGATFDNLGLALTFLFMFVTIMALLLRAEFFGKTETAPIIWFHIIVNAIALSVKFSIFPSLLSIFGLI